MRKIAICGVALAAATMSAQADLMIDVVGTSGSGVTTWTFSGSSTAFFGGTMRTNAGNTFNSGDTGGFPFGLDTILDISIQDQVLTFTGAASVTLGGNTESITGIFLDDDGGSDDDLGVRVANDLAYQASDATSWTGSGTVNVDIDAFSLGLWEISNAGGQAMLIGDPIIVNFSRVPAPTSMALLGLGGLVATRRRR